MAYGTHIKGAILSEAEADIKTETRMTGVVYCCQSNLSTNAENVEWNGRFQLRQD